MRHRSSFDGTAAAPPDGGSVALAVGVPGGAGGLRKTWGLLRRNPAEKKYSRNLGKAEGIELVAREIPAR